MPTFHPVTQSQCLDVPFRENEGERALQACVGMIFDYYQPGIDPLDAELDDFTENAPGQPLSRDTLAMLNFLYNGYEVKYIEPFSPLEYHRDRGHYINAFYRAYAAPHAAKYLSAKLDHQKESQRLIRLEQAADLYSLVEDAPPRFLHEAREASAADIARLIDEDWLPLLEVNGMNLAGRHTEYFQHYVLATGYDMRDGRVSNIYAHNLDDRYRNKPNQLLPTPLLARAWRSGAYALHAVRRPAPASTPLPAATGSDCAASAPVIQ